MLSYDDTEINFDINNYLKNDGSINSIVGKLLSIEKEYLLLVEKNNSLVNELYQLSENTISFIKDKVKQSRKIIDNIPNMEDFDEWYGKEGKNVNRLNLINYIEDSNHIPTLILKEIFVTFSSVLIGLVFGRWKIQGFDNIQKDGIIILNNDFIEDVIYELIEIIFGEDNFERVIDEELPLILGKDLLSWYQKDFFEEHIKKNNIKTVQYIGIYVVKTKHLMQYCIIMH